MFIINASNESQLLNKKIELKNSCHHQNKLLLKHCIKIIEQMRLWIKILMFRLYYKPAVFIVSVLDIKSNVHLIIVERKAKSFPRFICYQAFYHLSTMLKFNTQFLWYILNATSRWSTIVISLHDMQTFKINYSKKNIPIATMG